MNSEYHNLPVPYFLNTDYNEYRETGNLLHIEGVSSCTDARNNLIFKIMLLTEDEINLLISRATEELNLQFDLKDGSENHLKL